MYKEVIRPILTYVSEAALRTTKTTQRYQATEIKLIRKILNKTRKIRIRNKNNKEECQLQYITDWMGKAARDEKPMGTRSVGRATKR